MSNNLGVDHTANTATLVDFNSQYAVNAANTVALMFHRDAITTAKLMDVSSRIDYDPRRLGNLMVSKMDVGHKVTRPEGVIELKKS